MSLIFTTRRNLIFINELRRNPKIIYAKSVYLSDTETNQVVPGGRWVREKHGFMSVPLFARPGAVIAVGGTDGRPDYDYADGALLHVFELADGAMTQVRVPDMNGTDAIVCTVRRSGGTIAVSAAPGFGTAGLLLRNVVSVGTVDGATAFPHALGTLVRPNAGTQECTITVERSDA